VCADHFIFLFYFQFKNSLTEEVIKPTIQGTLNILEVAAKTPSVKRVVITSSAAAVMDIATTNDLSVVYDENSWNPATEEEAETSKAGYLGYLVGKTRAEQAAWDFVQSKKPSFDIVVLNPSYVFGPFVHHVDKISELNMSSKYVFNFITGEKEDDFPMSSYIDVRDAAEAHILVYENPKSGNQRYVLGAGGWTAQEIVEIAHKHFPGQIPAKIIGAPGSKRRPHQLNVSKFINEFQYTFISLEKSIVDSVQQLLELKQQGKWE